MSIYALKYVWYPPPPKKNVIEEDGEDESVTGGGERHGVGHYLSSGSQICLLEAKACEMQMGPVIDAAREVQAYLVYCASLMCIFINIQARPSTSQKMTTR